jgi:transposase
MKTYRLEEAAGLLGVSYGALYLWVRKAGMMPALKRQRALYDMRVHYLTEEQLQTLARAHNRVIGEEEQRQAELRELRERMAQLETALGVRAITQETPPLARTHVARWLEQHGVHYHTARLWRDLPLEPRAALLYAQEHLSAVGFRKGRNRLHPCSDPSCICHEALEPSEAQGTLF